MALVTRDVIRGVLVRWQRSEMSHQQVYDWVTEKFGLEQNDEGDPVVNEILAHLDIMDVNLTTPDDIPIFLRMLDEPSEADAKKMLVIHGSEIDMAARMAKWKSDPFYQPFCHPLGKSGEPVA